jgi:hypothetical protein
MIRPQAEDSGAWLWCSADDWVIDAVRKASPDTPRMFAVAFGVS